MAKKKFSGRDNFSADDDVEGQIEKHVDQFGVSPIELLELFPVYTRRIHLKRFLALYELYQRVLDLPGDIVELGVFKGFSLMAFANFMEIRNMGDRQKKLVGFDNFAGFESLDEKDGIQDERLDKVVGGFDSSDFEGQIRDAIAIFDNDRFIPYKERIELVKGDIVQTVPDYVNNNPGMRISILHCDVDLYQPTLVALRHLWPLVVQGGIVVFDEYAIRPWEGESRAWDEFCAESNIKLQIKRFDWAPNPGGYVVKE